MDSSVFVIWRIAIVIVCIGDNAVISFDLLNSSPFLIISMGFVGITYGGVSYSDSFIYLIGLLVVSYYLWHEIFVYLSVFIHFACVVWYLVVPIVSCKCDDVFAWFDEFYTVNFWLLWLLKSRYCMFLLYLKKWWVNIYFIYWGFRLCL